MKTNQAIDFKHFLDKFPLVELPITITEDSQYAFSINNDPLPALMIEQYLQPLDSIADDEFTEYLACFRIPDTKEFHAIVFWKARLLTYDYTLVTYTKKGELISKRLIAGTKVEGNLLVRSVATIDQDWIIYVVGGVSPGDSENYDPTSSQSINFEILANGQIIASK